MPVLLPRRRRPASRIEARKGLTRRKHGREPPCTPRAKGGGIGRPSRAFGTSGELFKPGDPLHQLDPVAEKAVHADAVGAVQVLGGPRVVPPGPDRPIRSGKRPTGKAGRVSPSSRAPACK